MKTSAGVMALVCAPTVAWTLTAPLPAGASTVQVVVVHDVPVTKFGPKLNWVVGAKFVPLMVTAIAPAPGPELGETPVMVGGKLDAVVW